MKTRRTSSPVVCEACETRRALRPQPERIPEDRYQLCRHCSDRLERLSLRPLEWYNLAKRHDPHDHLLGREYYSPGGIALMARDELEEEPHLLPAPVLQDVAHDLPLLWDHTLTRRQLRPKLLAAWRRHPKAAVAAHLIQIWESRQDGGVCGRVFLAWVPASCHEAETEPDVLGGEDHREQGAGCAGEQGAAEGGLEGAADLGMRADGETPDRHAEPPAAGALAETLRLGDGCAGDWETRRWMMGVLGRTSFKLVPWCGGFVTRRCSFECVPALGAGRVCPALPSLHG